MTSNVTVQRTAHLVRRTLEPIVGSDSFGFFGGFFQEFAKPYMLDYNYNDNGNAYWAGDESNKGW